MYKDRNPSSLPPFILSSPRSPFPALSELSCGSSLAGPQIFISDLAPVQCRGENRSRFPLISICLTVLSSLSFSLRGASRCPMHAGAPRPCPSPKTTRRVPRRDAGVRYRATASFAGYLALSRPLPRPAMLPTTYWPVLPRRSLERH